MFLTNNLVSQTLDAGAYGSDGLFVFGISKTRPVPSMRVKGSMYYNEKFQPGYLRYYNKMMTEKSYMRYNAFTDEIEMASSEITEKSSIIVFKDRHIAPVFSGETYVYLPYRLDDGRAYIGYLIELYNGDKFNLYLRRNKQFMEEVKARTGLENPSGSLIKPPNPPSPLITCEEWVASTLDLILVTKALPASTSTPDVL